MYKLFEKKLIKIIYIHFNISNENKLRSLLIVFVFIGLYNFSYTQTKPKDIINNKITNIKNKVKDDSLRIKGALKIYTGYRLFSQNNAKPFEYRISANINLAYRGLNLPLSYNFSNGRSLYRINAPSYNVPKFNNLGFSPTYKWAKLHIGNRNMSFSKYTYDNLRFAGWGTELTPGNFHLKFFNGKIFQSSLSDLGFANNLTLPYTRHAWGLMTGYKSKKSEYSIIAFKSGDKHIGIKDTSIYKKIKPKTNTSLGLVFKQNLFDNLDLNFDWAVSAITKNLYAQRIDIPSHFTFYNMAGLFEKKESSVYAYARRINATYSINDDEYGFSYEFIGKDYKTFGSLLFDNDYEAYTFNVGKKIEKLSMVSEVGIRKDGVTKESTNSGNRFVANVNLNYAASERLSLNASYSNFRNVERNYFQTFNSLAFDSLSLSLTNHNLNFSSSYSLDKERKSLLTMMFTNQISNRIQEDSVFNESKMTNQMITLNYSYNAKKINLSSSFTLLSNRTEYISTKGYIPNISLTNRLSEKVQLRSNIIYNHMMTSQNLLRSLIISQDCSYNISNKQSLIFTNRWNFNTTQDKFKLLENLIEMDYILKF